MLDQTNDPQGGVPVDSNSVGDSQEVALRSLFERSHQKKHLVELMLNGHRSKAIAFRLGISVHTVNCHLKAIYQSLQLHDRGTLMLLARRVLDRVEPPAPQFWGIVR